MAPNGDIAISAYQSILAGGAAGGIESAITYPTEYVKTRQQLAQGGSPKISPIAVLTSTVKQQGIRHLYTGAGVFCIANTSKSAIRFLAFDTAKRRIPTDSATGKVSPLGNMCAGVVAGIAESVTVVTPGETLKTKLVDDRMGPKMYRSTRHAIQKILSKDGPAGLYRGVFPVTLKQSANAMVRFTTYNFLLDTIRPLSESAAVPAMAGALAGIVTVYATMPFDSIKTRLQALGGDRTYKSSWQCVRAVVAAEGVQSLWEGTTPRLVRLSISGAISFSVYEQVIAWTSGGFWSEKTRIPPKAMV